MGSVNVQVTVDVPCVERVNAPDVVPVMVLPQLPVAVGALVIAAEH